MSALLAQKVIACCRELAHFSEQEGRTTRTFLSPPMRDVHRVLRAWMESIGMRTGVDAAGNLRGLYGSTSAPRLIIGSHLDTVPDAGAFDGILGVVMGIAMVELCAEPRPRIAIEVIGFSEEEGVRFGFPFIGSRALTGTLDASLLERQDSNGVSVSEALTAFGLDPAELPAVQLAPEAKMYLEFHIEQGPVLENLAMPLGVVDAIAGQSRWMLTFEGKANHAGTTPMKLRRDSLVAASQWILEVESLAATHDGLVATVGSVNVIPNAGNVVPGETRVSLDVRHARDSQRKQAVAQLLACAGEICGERGITLRCEERMNQVAVPMDPAVTDELAAAVELSGTPVYRITSGAGHDAMILAPVLPSTMLFLRSPGGISHHPDETVLVEDVEAALAAGLQFMELMRARYA